MLPEDGIKQMNFFVKKMMKFKIDVSDADFEVLLPSFHFFMPETHPLTQHGETGTVADEHFESQRFRGFPKRLPRSADETMADETGILLVCFDPSKADLVLFFSNERIDDIHGIAGLRTKVGDGKMVRTGGFQCDEGI